MYLTQEGLLCSSFERPRMNCVVYENTTGVLNVNALYSVTKTADDFLTDCNFSVIILQGNGFQSVVEIGKNFCRGCKNLEEINFIEFGNLKIIGSGFLENCPKLTYVNADNSTKIVEWKKTQEDREKKEREKTENKKSYFAILLENIKSTFRCAKIKF